MDEKLIEELLERIIESGLGLDMSNPNLKGTPGRIARMWAREFFSSADKGEEGFQNLTTFPNDKNYNQIIMLDRIHFVSMCSHHFLPFVGLAWVAYIPGALLVGASKPARLISFHSRKPQLQEALCHEVIENFEQVVKPEATFVLMRGIHGCMSDRGAAQYGGAGMMTSAVTGRFKSDGRARSEAMDMVKLSLMMQQV